MRNLTPRSVDYARYRTSPLRAQVDTSETIEYFQGPGHEACTYVEIGWECSRGRGRLERNRNWLSIGSTYEAVL